MADLHVELVAADRKVWAGDARMIIAKTTDGDLGVLPGHSPLLGVLLNGTVQVQPLQGELATFFRRSREAFFARDTEALRDAAWLVEFCRRCRDVERGAA